MLLMRLVRCVLGLGCCRHCSMMAWVLLIMGRSCLSVGIAALLLRSLHLLHPRVLHPLVKKPALLLVIAL